MQAFVKAVATGDTSDIHSGAEETLESHRIVFAGGNYAQRDAAHEHYTRLTDRRLPVVLINASIDQLPFPRV